MGLIGRLENEFYNKVFSGIENRIDDKKKESAFRVIWDEVRDEYETNHGRDILYRRMWLDDKMVEKIIWSQLRRYPSSREFVSDIFAFAKKIMGNDFDENACIDFTRILMENLLCCDEFSEKVIKVRQDYELGQQTQIMKTNVLGIGKKEDRHFIDEKESEENRQEIINEAVIDLFADNFMRVMFMQRKHEAQIKLKDIYIENDYKVIFGDGENQNLLSFIYQFCSTMDKSPMLFIEGHAGIGKSSLVSKMAYDFKNGANIWKEKKLAIIQLRNLAVDSQDLDIHNPWADFKRYLQFNGSIRKMFSILDEYILVLDGFDELCLIDNIRLEHKLIYVANIVNFLEDYQCGCKIIVTTRPNYLARRDEWKMIYQNPIVISLDHFSCEKRMKWIKKAKDSGLEIAERVENNLASNLHKDVEVVASTPFTLYLIAHENIEISENDDLWSVYTKIFGVEVIRKRYDRLNGDDEINSHPGTVISKIIYMTTKEIAYYMFCNNKMDIDWDEIKICIELVMQMEIIDQKNVKVDNTDQIKTLLKDSFALFNYYTETETNGGISFYHNYIREFFIQEKVHEELLKIYVEGRKYKGEERVVYIKEKLYDLLSRGRLSDKTIDFLKSYETVNKDNVTWGSLEEKSSFLPKIFTDILIDLGDKYYDENIIVNLWMLLNVINNVYKQKKSREKENYYEIFDKNIVSMSNGKNNIEYYFELISKAVDIERIDLSGINLRGKVLQNMTFNKCDFGGTILSGATIKNVKFIDCKLSGSDLRGAILENVQFSGCDMDGGKFRGIEINIGEFVHCSVKQCQLHGARIIKVLFDDTDIENAILEATEFIQSQIFDIGKKDVSAFVSANIENLKWKNNSDKEEFYNELYRLKNSNRTKI
ncbi:MAG: hypothetical protein HDQ99_01695 [Lachnospiraceae bacterium]|nr:hypothetical protein [Lachnospiraceae bacterium]